jgi:hypothetical protein
VAVSLKSLSCSSRPAITLNVTKGRCSSAIDILSSNAMRNDWDTDKSDDYVSIRLFDVFVFIQQQRKFWVNELCLILAAAPTLLSSETRQGQDKKDSSWREWKNGISVILTVVLYY